jgi:hypothetical protein
MLYKVIVVVLLLFVLNAQSQNVSGYWYGAGKVDVEGQYNNYMIELKLKQMNKNISGRLSYYFRDSLFTEDVEGSYELLTRSVKLKSFSVSYYKNSSTRLGVDCPMTAALTLLTTRTENVLKGSFISEEAFKYTCPVININLTNSCDTLPFIALKEKEPEEEIPVLSVATRKISERRKDIVQTIEIVSDSVQIAFYDNGVIDYDSVSLYVDNRLVKEKHLLSEKAFELNVFVDKKVGFTDISMIAENVGTIPPNTAVMVLYDGRKRYEIQMESDFNKTATVRLIRKK